MATMQEILTLVLRELSMAAGRGVQIQSEDRIANKVNQMYRTISTKYWWDTQFRTVMGNLDGAGSIAQQLADPITATKHVHSVFINNDVSPLSWMTKGQNIMSVRARCLYPAKTANIPFTVLPLTETGTVVINYRAVQEKDFGLDDEIPLDKDLMVLGTAMAMAISDGLNDDHAKTLGQGYNDHLKTLIDLETKASYNPFPLHRGVMTDWYDNGQ